ncbi:hypothetical protein [Cesiribacter sp. SM1]|uniref:hypothetical protein n=1 Tax=Cesiribacter sp. SM1 TaxID=2861196 RepID=UPI001CD5F4ED|nr:hypothetical protein [Cesiribacter sp. SM1]
MKKILLVLFLFATAVACDQYEAVNPEKAVADACGLSDPTQELAWLRERIDNSAEPSADNPCQLGGITQGTYGGQTVFIMSVGGPLCCPCAGSAVYNCEGELVMVCNPEEEAKITNKEVIWKKNTDGE